MSQPRISIYKSTCYHTCNTTTQRHTQVISVPGSPAKAPGSFLRLGSCTCTHTHTDGLRFCGCPETHTPHAALQLPLLHPSLPVHQELGSPSLQGMRQRTQASSLHTGTEQTHRFMFRAIASFSLSCSLHHQTPNRNLCMVAVHTSLHSIHTHAHTLTSGHCLQNETVSYSLLSIFLFSFNTTSRRSPPRGCANI